MLHSLWKYIRHKKKIYLWILIFILVDYSTSVVPTQVTQTLINHMTDSTLTSSILYRQLAWLAITATIMYICSTHWTIWLGNAQVDYDNQLKKQLFKKLTSMRRPYYEKFRSGDMLTRFTSDIDNLSELLDYGLMSLIYSLGMLLFIFPQMFQISLGITALSIVPLILLVIIINRVSNAHDNAISENREAVAALSNEVLEVVEGIQVIRAYANEEASAAKFSKKTDELVKKSTTVMLFQAAYGRITYLLFALNTAVILLLGSYYLQLGNIQLGDIVALQMYSWLLIEPLWMFSDFILLYKTGLNSFEKVNELLETTDSLEEDGEKMLETCNVIEWKNYSFKYASSDHWILVDISLKIQKGQTLGIIGKTGSGKTTFVRQLLRQYPIGDGNLLMNGLPIQMYQRSSIEKHIGYVPQEHILFSRTIKENIQMGKVDATMDEIRWAVEVAHFSEDIERIAEGYDALIGEKGLALSGGQKQRLSIARALINDPQILILDDALSAVDAKTERAIINNIKACRQGKTNLIVTHRLSAVQHADWIIVLEDGKIIEEGTPTDLMALNGWYAEQYNLQQKEAEESL